jgi:hypothetical protein
MANIKNSKTERGRVRFNVLDAFIIILVIAAVVGVYFRYSILDFLRSDMNAEKYVVTYSMDDIRYTTPNYIHADDKVYFASSGELFGTIIRESENQGVLNIMPASKEFVDSSGAIKKVFYPNSESRVTAKGRLLCDGGYDSNGAFFINKNTYVSAGQILSVRTDMVSVSIRILSIEPYTE